MNIYYFGKPYSFTHIAALKRFGKENHFVSRSSIDKTIDSLEKNSLAVVPIENTYGGEITQTVDKLIELCVKNLNDNFPIKEELEMKIELYLLGGKQIKPNKIKRIYSNEHALRESKAWLEKYVPNAKTRITGSTSEACAKIKKEGYSCSIASSEAAEHYELKKIAKIDAGEIRNLTRFLVIGKK
jgi:prephenate dehydratase